MAGLFLFTRKVLKRKFIYLYNKEASLRHYAKQRNVTSNFHSPAMNYNLKRHKLLEILAHQNLNVQLEKPSYLTIGVSYEEICKDLDVTELELGFLTAELYDNKEIGYHDAYNVEGLFAENKEITAYSNKKYLKLSRKGKIENIKDIIQIVIPVLSVVVAILALTLRLESINSENEKRFQKIEQKINNEVGRNLKKELGSPSVVPKR